MSTRTNIVISYGNSKVFVYRHCDGYPAETGADLIARMQETPHPADFTRGLLAELYEKQPYEQQARPVYELTSELHGDIEHVYYLYFNGLTGKFERLAYAAYGNSNRSNLSWTRLTQSYSLDEFTEIVNADRCAINRRLAQMRQESPRYKDCSDYPMLAPIVQLATTAT